MWRIVITALVTALTYLLWRFLDYTWIKPKRMERFLRKQGMKGTHYKFPFGDSEDFRRLFDEVNSKPIGIQDDVMPRLMPHIITTVQKYGSFSFSWSGPRARITILDPIIAKDCLNKWRTFIKTFKLLNFRSQMVTTGLVFLEGDEWTKSRARLNPSFHWDKLKPMVPTIKSCCNETLDEWRQLAISNGGKCVIDVFVSLEVFTSNILSHLMFNSPYTDRIKETFLQLIELAHISGVHSHLPIPGDRYIPTERNRKAITIDNTVRATLTSMIDERLEKKDSKRNGDLLDVVMEDLYDGKFSNKSERYKLIEEAIGQCKIFFFAGSETNSNLLTWAMVLLSVNQDCQDRARKEVLQVLGNKKDFTFEEINKLKYINMVILEVLRLYPPVMELSRLVDEDTKIENYIIPKGALVTLPTLVYHRSTEIWGDDANEFRPERFADGVAKAGKGDPTYLPFGWGPRICIGNNFAMVESKTLLSMILREFHFQLSPTYAHAPVSALTVYPQFGAPIILTKL